MDQMKARVEKLAARLAAEGRDEDAALCKLVVSSLKSADESYRNGFNDALKHAMDLIRNQRASVPASEIAALVRDSSLPVSRSD